MLERRQTLETLPSGDRERIVFVLDSLMLKPAKPINLVPDSHPIKKPLRAAFCFSGIPVPADYASLIRPTRCFGARGRRISSNQGLLKAN